MATQPTSSASQPITSPLPSQPIAAPPTPAAPHPSSHRFSYLKHLGHLGLEAFTRIVPFIAQGAEDVEPEFDLLFPLEGPIYNSVVRAICMVEMAGTKDTAGSTKLQSVAGLVAPHLRALAAHYGIPEQELDTAIPRYINGLVAILNGPELPPGVAAPEQPCPPSAPPTTPAQPSPQPAPVNPSPRLAQDFGTPSPDPLPSSPPNTQAMIEADTEDATTLPPAPPPTPPLTSPQSSPESRPVIIDLSHNNGSVDLTHVSANGVVAVIHKATQGNLFRDPAYLSTRTLAAAAGLLWGAYHFGTGDDGEAQAKHFLATAAPDPQTILALDIEANRQGESISLEQAKAFVQFVHQQTGRWPGVYGGYYLKQLLGTKRDPILSNCWLWLAQYDDKPTIQSSWTAWNLWQYTDGSFGIPTDPLPGVGVCDRSFFNGTPDQLTTRWSQGTLS